MMHSEISSEFLCTPRINFEHCFRFLKSYRKPNRFLNDVNDAYLESIRNPQRNEINSPLCFTGYPSEIRPSITRLLCGVIPQAFEQAMRNLHPPTY